MEGNITEEQLSQPESMPAAAYPSAEEGEAIKKRKQDLIFDGPIAELVTIDRFAPYAGFTTGAVRAMCRRRQLPAHKMKDPEKPNSDGTWYINRARWDKLAEILPELEPPEWHSWEDYWTYDRKSAALKMKEKAKKAGAHGRASTTRRSKLEMSKGTA